MMKKSFLITIVATMLASGPLFAGGLDDMSWRSVNMRDGFIVDCPTVDPQSLAMEVGGELEALDERIAELDEYLEENKLSAKDGVIVAVMPGGLIYGAYRAASLKRKRNELDALDDQASELGWDLAELQAYEASEALAQNP